MVSKKDKYLAAAQKFLERGQLDKALAEFAKVVQEDPKDTRTWLKMAEVHAKRGAAEQATDIYLKTGEQYTEQGFFQKAVAVYKNVLKLSPGFVPGHIKLADVYKRLGLLSDAVQQYELAATGLQRAGKSTEALATLRQIVELNPDNVASRIKLAESASQAGLTEEATTELGKAAEQLKAQGRTDEYVRVAERLLFHQPDNLPVARALAEAYIGKNNARLALAKLQTCLRDQPRDPETVSLVARAFEQLDVPKAVSVWKELAAIHHDAGRASQRDAAINKVLALDPRDPEAQELQRQYGEDAASFSRWGAPPKLASLRSPGPDTGTRPPPVPFPADPVGVKRSGGTGASGTTVPPAPPSGSNPDVTRILAEADVFVKYGLLDRAVDHLRRIFHIQPDHQPALDKLSSVLGQLGRSAELGAVRNPAPVASAAAPAAPLSAAPPHSTATDPADDLERTDQQAPPTAPDETGVDVEIEIEPLELEVVDLDGAESGPSSATATGPFDGDETRDDDHGLRLDSFDEGVSLPTEMVDSRLAPPVATADQRSSATFDLFDDHAASAGEGFEHSAGTTLGAFDESPPTTLGTFEDLPPAESARQQQPPTVIGAVDGELLAELEQVDFFIQQSMAEDAMSTLEDLRQRFGVHPAIEQKLEQVRRLLTDPPGSIPRATTAADDTRAGVADDGASPIAVVAGGEVADLSTHGDLGIAYKEMGLLDPAIAEFKLLTQDPRRRVFALTMIGQCCEAKGALKDAVVHYKEALNSPSATDDESTLLYYLLGNTFETLNDRSEAVYFYEKVSRREPHFRDVEARLAALKPAHVRRA